MQIRLGWWNKKELIEAYNKKGINSHWYWYNITLNEVKSLMVEVVGKYAHLLFNQHRHQNNIRFAYRI